MTKDTPYVPWDWPIEKKLKLLPATPAPPQFKTVRGVDRIRLTSHEIATDTFFETLHARRTHREFASGKVSLENVSKLLQTTWGVQGYFAKAAALFIMTAVFARTMWKYGRARAYRVVLLETGHLCQTFCLTATRLGLAPFSTAALNDSMIEKDLGLDGISESVLYVAGVGLRAPQ